MKRFLEVNSLLPKTTTTTEAEEPKRQRYVRNNINEVNIHPRDSQITFHDEGHFYTDDNNNRFRISVSTFKALFTIPFNEEETIQSKFQFPVWCEIKKCMVVGKSKPSAKNPKDFGLSRAEAHAKMKAKATFGTNVHQRIENYFLCDEWEVGLSQEERINIIARNSTKNGLPIPTDQELNCLQQMLTVEDAFLNDGWRPYRVEHRIFTGSEYSIAGSVDMLLARKRRPGKKQSIDGDNDLEFMVLDWKTTSKDIHKPMNWKYKNFFYPLNHMANCPKNEYFIQESIYGTIYKLYYGFDVVEIWAAVLNPERPIIGIPVYKTPLLEKEVMNMLTVWKNFLKFERDIIIWCGNSEKAARQRLTYLYQIPGFALARTNLICDEISNAFLHETGLFSATLDNTVTTDYKCFIVPPQLLTAAHLIVYGQMRIKQTIRQKMILNEKIQDQNHWFNVCKHVEFLLRSKPLNIVCENTICNILVHVSGMDLIDLTMHTMREDGNKNFFPTLRGKPIAYQPLKLSEEAAAFIFKHKHWGTLGEILAECLTRSPPSSKTTTNQEDMEDETRAVVVDDDCEEIKEIRREEREAKKRNDAFFKLFRRITPLVQRELNECLTNKDEIILNLNQVLEEALKYSA
jgi:PD-(D/E)XK nuclease superfamily